MSSRFSEEFSEFVRDLVTTQACMLGGNIPDAPQRTAAPDDPITVPFLDLPIRRQLEAAEYACRRDFYRQARSEAIQESERYEQWLQLLTDPEVSPAEVGRMAREIVLAYLDSCAAKRGERLEDL